MNRSFFCFIHIPKCGGVSFGDILRRNLSNGYHHLSHGLYEGPLSAFNLKLYIQENSNRLGIGGHRLSLDIPFAEIEGCDIKAISFVRSPIERIRSEFFYLKKLPGNIGQNPLIRQLTYSDYLVHLLKNSSNLDSVSQYQTKYLFGKLPYRNEVLQTLIKTQRVLLFPLECFDDACMYLEKAFPRYFIDASYVRRNVNEKKVSSHESLLETELCAKLSADNQLMAAAKQQSNTLISEAFTPEELIKAKRSFDQRCWKRHRLYEPIQKLAHKAYRATASW